MSVAGLEQFHAVMPEMRKAHDMVADEVDECLEILRQGFVSNRFGSSMYVPSYDRWSQVQSELPSYRRYVDVLRLIGVNEQDKRWLLKNPGHVAEIDALLEVMPDASEIERRIAERAYFLWCERGGDENSNWLEAERQIVSELGSSRASSRLIGRQQHRLLLSVAPCTWLGGCSRATRHALTFSALARSIIGRKRWRKWRVFERRGHSSFMTSTIVTSIVIRWG